MNKTLVIWIFFLMVGLYNFEFILLKLSYFSLYFSGGRPIQPGCEGFSDIIYICSHQRAFILYAESIRSEAAFIAYECLDWTTFMENKCKTNSVKMGEYAFEKHSVTGSYFLETSGGPKSFSKS